MANQLRHRNNLATWESINHQTKLEKLLDLLLGARNKFLSLGNLKNSRSSDKIAKLATLCVSHHLRILRRSKSSS